MNDTTLKQAMPIVATALGRKFGVQVQVGGQQAATDGRTIWLPDLPADSQLRPVAWGLLAHEASHVRHTDMAAFQTQGAVSPLRRHLLNLLEDIRIELAIRRDYPGTERTLSRVIDWLLTQGHLDPPQVGDHPAHILSATLLLMLRHRILGQSALCQQAQSAEQVLRQTFPGPLVHRLMGLMTEVRGLASTTAAAELAERIEGLLDAEAKRSPSKETESPDPEAGAGRQQDDADDENEAASDAPPSNGSQDPDAATDVVDPDGDDDEEASAGQAEGNASPQPPAGDKCGEAAVQSVLAAGEADLGGDLFATVRQVLGSQSGDASLGVSRLPIPEDPACLILGSDAGKDGVQLRLRHQTQIGNRLVEGPALAEHLLDVLVEGL